MDFGPGAASPKGNMDPPSLCTVPLLSLSHPLQLLILSLEGVAGSDSGRGSQGRTLGPWVVARLLCLHLLAVSLCIRTPRGPLLFNPLALKMFWGESKPSFGLEMRRRRGQERADRWEECGENEPRAENWAASGCFKQQEAG